MARTKKKSIMLIKDPGAPPGLQFEAYVRDGGNYIYFAAAESRKAIVDVLKTTFGSPNFNWDIDEEQTRKRIPTRR